MLIESFHIFALVTIMLWVLGGATFSKAKTSPLGLAFLALGNLVLATYLTLLWTVLERPPLRTLGETRLAYAILLSIIGLIIYYRYQLRWFLYYSLAMSALFLIINVASPEVLDKTLMPALQSPWFIPHVVVYMEAYALLGGASLLALHALFRKTEPGAISINIADSLVYLGYSFLTLGLLFGALWAKTAWGHYWSWDPKETWALLTWLCYLIYIHIRYYHKTQIRLAHGLLVASFFVLIICWFGVNYLPSANQSVHVYAG